MKSGGRLGERQGVKGLVGWVSERVAGEEREGTGVGGEEESDGTGKGLQSGRSSPQTAASGAAICGMGTKRAGFGNSGLI